MPIELKIIYNESIHFSSIKAILSDKPGPIHYKNLTTIFHKSLYYVFCLSQVDRMLKNQCNKNQLDIDITDIT